MKKFYILIVAFGFLFLNNFISEANYNNFEEE
mgnify:CR=1 FL=1